MRDLNAFFEQRVAEADSYMELLSALEKQSQAGRPRFRMEDGDYQISSTQQKILYSSVYIQLYNLVESTISTCIEEVGSASAGRLPAHLQVEIQKEWIRRIARTHVELNSDKRLESAHLFFEQSFHPVEPFSIEKGGGGNWDDNSIEAIGKRLGVPIRVESAVYSLIKRKIRDDHGPLGLVKDLRNKLAHGEISFSECAEGVTVSQLRNITNITVDYMRGIVGNFVTYIAGLQFLKEQHRTI
jgi:MAE_28990/MAE_18760-like HEPN